MNDYDDSDEYTSSNSFRARSNTWPLNRPDLAIPGGVCIDETLPEIELEEDDLFTTNENWTTGLDHDIMSWDPILNAQSQQQHLQAQQVQNDSNPLQSQQPQLIHNQSQHQQPSTIHHHHPLHQSSHQRERSLQQDQPQMQHTQTQQQLGSTLNNPTMILTAQTVPHHPHSQQSSTQHHQTLNDTRCLPDGDDPNDYHIQQLHHLRIDNNHSSYEHQSHHISPLSTVCVQGSTSTLATEGYAPSDHQLQPLISARYDIDHQNDLDLRNHNDELHQHLTVHHLTSSSLDHHQADPNMLSSSLGTSGLGMSGDLEDLDYKGVDPSSILQIQPFDDQLPDHQLKQEQTTNESKQPSAAGPSGKTKASAPRRNAWGNMSYADLISQAINSTNDKRLTLSQIYDWMVQHVPYFKDKGDSNSSAGWKNSVRHNLSLHNRFKRLQNEGTGKSSWWTINPEANVNKCARRRAASMEASKYEKKRGRAKKRAEAIRQGLISYPSLTNSSLNGSTCALEPQSLHQQSLSQFGSQQQIQLSPTHQTQRQSPPQPEQPQPQQQQQQQQPNQLTERLSSNNNLQIRQATTNVFVAQSQAPYEPRADIKVEPQQLQQAHPQPPPTSSPPAPQQQPQQQPQHIQPHQQQHHAQLEQQPTANQVQHIHQQQQHQQVHHVLQKVDTLENDSYYIQHQHQHDHLPSQQTNMIASSDHMDLFGRHAIYMEPCNDCNCTELINCGTNAMSFT